MDYAKRLERVEKEKARENLKLAGEGFQISEKVNTNKKVAEKTGFGSHDTYNKAKFIAENSMKKKRNTI